DLSVAHDAGRPMRHKCGRTTGPPVPEMPGAMVARSCRVPSSPDRRAYAAGGRASEGPPLQLARGRGAAGRPTSLVGCAGRRAAGGSGVKSCRRCGGVRRLGRTCAAAVGSKAAAMIAKRQLNKKAYKVRTYLFI